MNGARGAAGRAEHPLDIGGNGKTPRPSGQICDLEPGYLYRIVDRHVLQELERNAVRDVLEPAVALAVPRDIGRAFLANRERRRSPEIAVVLVAKIDRLARRIAHRIVRPWA